MIQEVKFMDKQEREARQMAKELPFREKVSYIWMYYKNWIITGIVVLLMVGTTAYQIATRPTYDLEIGYYAEKTITDETITALEEYLANYVEDIDGDGVSTVKIYANIASVIGGGQEAMYAIQNKLLAELTTAQYPAYFFDDFFYDMMQKGDCEGCMESFRDVEESDALKTIINPDEGTKIYWGTRSLYETEKDKPKNVTLHEKAVEAEIDIFGDR